MYRNRLKILPLVAVILVIVSSAFGHGARVTWELQGDSVHTLALFDDGQPMDSAQVTVFSGAAPSVPYLSGSTNENGEFTFVPDREESENWDVQVRMAGHGDIVHIALSDDSAFSERSGRFSVFQIVLMSICVVWGFIGTALFFASKRKKYDAHP